MAQSDKIEQRTEDFIKAYEKLKGEAKFKNNKELIDILGIKSQSTISEILAKRQNIQPEQWKKFKEHFGYNVARETENSEIDYKGQPGAIVNNDYLVKRRAQKNSVQPFLAPLVPFKAQAGYVKAEDQSVFIDALEKYALPPGVNPQGAVWRWWEIEGTSMMPVFKSGQTILTSQVPFEDWAQIRNFYVYVIVTETRVLVKRLFAKSPDQWVLISENEKEYPQKLLPVQEVKELWVFRRKLVDDAPPSKMFKIKV
ncbi:MAG: S24 family peptidase [Chitinophagaceae bacterium]